MPVLLYKYIFRNIIRTVLIYLQLLIIKYTLTDV